MLRTILTVLAGLICLPICLPICRAQTASSYTISTVAGNNTAGFSGDGGTATSAQLSSPSTVILDANHVLYIADGANQRVREVSSSGTITTVAGNGTAGFAGDGKAGTAAEIDGPFAVAVLSSGTFYISEVVNNLIRQVTSGDTISTVAGVNSSGAGYSGDGGLATAALINQPTGLAVDSAGDLYIADTGNNVIRLITASTGDISTFAGTGVAAGTGDGGQAGFATLNAPRGLAVDSQGNLYICDTANHRIREVNTSGVITTIAGNGTQGFSGDGGAATSAQLNTPYGVAVDSAGNVYIADYLNSRVRKVSTNGVITTIAGNGSFSYSGDGGPATSASLFFPSGVAVDSSGNVYIADNQNNVIRKLTPVPQIIMTGSAPAVSRVEGASAYGGFSTVAPGSWIEIYGTNLASDTRSWATSDFKGANAPTSLDGTTVTIGGEAAFVSYISPTQINAQVPSNAGLGAQYVTVDTAVGNSGLYPITLNALQPGLLAPPSFNLGGIQNVGAVFPDGTTYVLPPGAVPGITSRRTKPGDTITIYGVGFGSVTPSYNAGQVATRSNTLTMPFQIYFGNTPATVTYMGLAPDTVGLYQFNVVVPNIAASDAVPLTFSLGHQNGTQTLYIAVQNP